MVTHIVIPVRDQLYLTQSIVEQLKRQQGWDKCWIFDNGSVDDTWNYLMSIEKEDPRFKPIHAAGAGIYEMWEQGFVLAKHEKAEFVAIFNNDINLAPGTIQYLKGALLSRDDIWISYPDYNATSMHPNLELKETHGTYRHGGMSGFCFMLRTNPIDWEPLVDPIFKWYGGDDDIAFEVERRGGRQIRVVGLPVEHFHEATSRHFDLGAQKAADMQSIFSKWGK